MKSTCLEVLKDKKVGLRYARVERAAPEFTIKCEWTSHFIYMEMEEGQRKISLKPLFAAMDRLDMQEETIKNQKKRGLCTAITRHMSGYNEAQGMNGIKRIQLCRRGLEALDRRGWDRSFHQRLFHEEYLKSCARIFFKRDGPGAFAISHNRLLEVNSWDSTPQEVLVSTPRRFGKTISVSMFAAAMMFSCPNLELSIYSTCKRISQKLLRNIVKFLDIIYLELGVAPYKVLRLNSEEVHVAGNEGHGDVRVINSYPSKIGIYVSSPLTFLFSICFVSFWIRHRAPTYGRALQSIRLVA